ncbi:Mutator mutT protein (7,8-dihydro-8-oxoguanine-triphosphatase) [Marinilactibacillus psychrotolerans 42ea]|uniref:8-oxo-dGTP diphosphatase n=1 Tax=Marinilactibacillus psychrotolerans 42ea TaxID=1255609 RepID=A0A1R4K5K1_9LACT|nr:(deoxy)nucleoside triphosphate pyrophosphohydrolase [Marinilactibacillus psychrotolerans]SJN39640.1 Mutator mutT protein (7,8-dihydro-8-oxoguanine-triphosphatase) [Marinilactibacillus psychrotolerans 42ea]
MKQINVVGAILIEDGTILCAQRGAEKSLPNLWEFPGGKIEQGETPQEALVRELEEELLIEVDVKPDQFEHTSYEYDFGIVHLTTFICILKNGTPKLTEHIEVRWLKPEELNSVEWAPADIPAVEKLISEGITV